MKLLLLDDKGQILSEPYILRLQGWSEERYLHEAPPDQRCEFVEGEVIMYCPMSTEHSKMVTFLLRLLGDYCDAKNLGEVMSEPTTRLSPGVNRQPDICFVPREKAHLAKGLPMEVVPPFIIEVSWSTREIDLGEKARDYERAFVQEYWVVDIEEKDVVVHILEQGQYQRSQQKSGRLESRIVSGFYVEIDWLWQEPLPSAWEAVKGILGE